MNDVNQYTTSIQNPEVLAQAPAVDPFAVLEHQASQHDANFNAQYAAASTGEPAPLPPDPAAEFGIILTMARAVLAPLYPSLGAIYTDAVIEQLGTAAAPVMQKYGVTSGGVLERFGPEITLAVVAGPIALQTVKAIRHDNEERRKAREAEAANADQAEAVANGAHA